MRRIIVCEFITTDGVLQSPGGPNEDTTNNFKWGGWSVPFWDNVMNEKMADITSKPYDLLLGRRTYEIFSAFWPRQKDETGKTFNRIEKYVVTDNLVDLSWARSIQLKDDVVGKLRGLKVQEGPDLLVYGSGKLLQTLFRNDLIDLLHIWTFPVSIGSGQKLFEEGTPVKEWALVDSAVSTTGVIMASYTPKGELRTGTMG